VCLFLVLVLLAHCRVGEWTQRTGVGENLSWYRRGRAAVKCLPVGLGAGQGQGAPLRVFGAKCSRRRCDMRRTRARTRAVLVGCQ
jgi:hypothetical protein